MTVSARMLLVLALSALCSAPFAAPAGAESAKVMGFNRADEAMNSAMEAARASLPDFLDRAKRADLASGDYRVKWAHPGDGAKIEAEHLWVTLTSVQGSSVEGILADQPQSFRGAIGDKVSFATAAISDWMHFRADGLVEGCYTTRVMISRMEEEERLGYEAQLAPLPEPASSRPALSAPMAKLSAGN